jgi:hypothetical protein
MNFKGHLTTGACSALVVGYCAYQFQSEIPFIRPIPVEFISLTCLFFALFPDLDISSIPQRWFYRILFVGLTFLAFLGYWKLSTYAALISILPLLSKHRGWTHHPATTFIFPFFLIIFYAFVLEHYQIKAHTTSLIVSLFKHYGWLYVAAVVGWWTHLWSDGIGMKSAQKKRKKK